MKALRIVALCAGLLLVPTAIAAQDQDAAAERSASFEAVEGASHENVSGMKMLVWAYALVWSFSLIYLVRLGRLEARLAADVARLEKALGERAPD